MKIGNSTITFHTSLRFTSFDDVPYWTIYTRVTDCFERAHNKRGVSFVPLTYSEIVQWLTHTPNPRRLEAYPRKTRARRASRGDMREPTGASRHK